MADNKEKTTAQVVVEEEDTVYNDILDKFENPTESKKGTKAKKGHIKALIASLAGAAVLVGIVCLLVLMPKLGDSQQEATSPDGASITSKTDKNNVWQNEVKTDSNGKIETNGSGELMEYIPSQISKIHVENKFGTLDIKSYTPTEKTKETDPETGEQVTKTQATVYTLVGFENFDMQTGVPDEIANYCASLSYNTVIEADASDNLSDYGLDKPRSVVTVTYTDKKKVILYIGNEAPQGVGTYVKFGDSNAVYLCEDDSVKPLLYGVNDLISRTINSSADSTENTDFEYVNLTGSAYGKKITLKMSHYTKSISNSYIITEPVNIFADDGEASKVAGAVRGLYAESVVCVNPTSAQLAKYGLSSEYAHVYAKYPDTTVDLIASKPDSKNNCYLMKKGGKVVYKIAATSIPWVLTSYDKLVSTYIVNPQFTGLSGVEIGCGSKTYKFDVSTVVANQSDDENSTASTTTTTVKYNGSELDEGYFENFFRNMALLTKCDNNTSTSSAKPELTIKYSYADKSKSEDTIKFVNESGTSKHIVYLNSKPVGHVYSSYVSKLISQTPQIAKNKEVKTFF